MKKGFVNQLKIILDQHINLVESNSKLLQINLDLMKENKELLKNQKINLLEGISK